MWALGAGGPTPPGRVSQKQNERVPPGAPHSSAKARKIEEKRDECTPATHFLRRVWSSPTGMGASLRCPGAGHSGVSAPHLRSHALNSAARAVLSGVGGQHGAFLRWRQLTNMKNGRGQARRGASSSLIRALRHPAVARGGRKFVFRAAHYQRARPAAIPPAMSSPRPLHAAPFRLERTPWSCNAVFDAVA